MIRGVVPAFYMHKIIARIGHFIYYLLILDVTYHVNILERGR